VAPFEVVDRAGQRVFYVSPEHEVEFYRGRKRVAVMSALGGVGTFWALSSNPQLVATLTATQLTMKEQDQVRIVLGKNPKHGNYLLQFASGSSQNVAAIGVSWQTNSGAAFIYDAAGNLKAEMTTPGNQRGNVAVMANEKQPLAKLTETVGGQLLICSATSCEPAMAEALDGGGYGIVAAGPAQHTPGGGLVTAIGSMIRGKKQ
jgi:hypothetical protein